MRKIPWKWFLPVVQVTVAFACFFYAPRAYLIQAYKDGVVNNAEYTWQHFPPAIERMSKGLNFPALLLNFPLRNSYTHLYQYDAGKYGNIWITFNDLGFFFWVAVVWHVLGRKLDQSLRGEIGSSGTRGLTLAALVCGLAFGILAGAYAIQMILSQWRPERQIGIYGIVWSLATIVYFVWQLFQLRKIPSAAMARQ